MTVTGETVTTASGLKYIDQVIATSGAHGMLCMACAWHVHMCMACWRVHVLTYLLHVWPGPSPTVGNIVGFNAKVSIGDQVIVDTLG